MSAERWTVAVGSDATSAAFDPPSGTARGPVFVCAHGAGGNMDDKAVLAVSSTLTGRGIGVVRFNFLYRTRGKGAPDPMPRLMACFSAVNRDVAARWPKAPLVIGGRSMGGRTASMLASEGEPCAGPLLLAYPLHPPGQPAKLRVEHLPRITVPVLALSGTRDTFATPEIMNSTIAGLGDHWQLHWIEAADHSFLVQKKSGRTNAEVQQEVGDTVGQWLARVR
jgi:hypothetical protein